MSLGEKRSEMIAGKNDADKRIAGKQMFPARTTRGGVAGAAFGAGPHNSVVFPAPLGPIIATTRRPAMLAEIPWTIAFGPPSFPLTVSPRSWNARRGGAIVFWVK